MKHCVLRGVTLLEWVCVIGVLSVLAAVAVPSLQHWIAKARTQTAVNDFTAGLAQARSEAIRRGLPVVIQRRDDCPHKDWSCGWFSFHDNNHNLVLDKEETVIRMFDAPQGVLVSTNASGLKTRLRLTSGGASQGVSSASFFFQSNHNGTCTRLLISAGLRWRTENC